MGKTEAMQRDKISSNLTETWVRAKSLIYQSLKAAHVHDVARDYLNNAWSLARGLPVLYSVVC